MAEIKTVIKLQISAGKANPAPPIGPALGQHGLNIQDFCLRFNDLSKDRIGEIVPVEITVFDNRTFDLKLKTAPAADLLRKAAGVQKGAADPWKHKVGQVSERQIQDIAEKKMEDLNANDIENAKKIIKGTARSMGIEIK